jgi:hypothetical protein
MPALPPPPLTKADLAPLVGRRGEQALQGALAAATDPAAAPPALLRLLGRFIQFNAAFGAGVANLAGEIAARPDLFRDPEEPVKILADRAAEVAADFFHAAVDEFDDRLTPWRDTHRTLAQATLKAAGAHFGYAPAELDRIVGVDAATEAARASVWEGYGVGATLDERRLFSAMGFHAGSEVLADQEFTIIDRSLRARRPELVAALEKARVGLGGEKHAAYYWIHIHTSVEADHFEAALAGVNKALRFYAGAQPPGTVRGFLLEGFARFGAVQAGFMEGLLSA